MSVAPQPTQAAPDDLRVQLDAAHRTGPDGASVRGGGGAEAKGLVRPCAASLLTVWGTQPPRAISWDRERPGRQLGRTPGWFRHTVGHHHGGGRLTAQTDSGCGNRHSAGEESHQSGAAGQSTGWGVFPLLSHPQKGWEAETDFGPAGTQHIFEAPALQDVDGTEGPSVHPPRRLGCHNRPGGRLFSNSNMGGTQTIPQVRLRRQNVRVLCPAFGISLAPRTFTRCMDAVLAPLRREGVRILNYLND